MQVHGREFLMIFPRKLKPGSRIGVVAPSYWMSEKLTRKARIPFEEAGYSLVFGFSTLLRYNAYAGSPAERARDIHCFFEDDSIDAIICLRGGYGINRVLKHLEFDLIKLNPKIFVGYSDITGLLTSISRKTGLVTFHGPMLSSFKKETDAYTFQTLINMLSGNITCVPLPEGEKPRTLRSGSGQGKLWGGNLTLIVNRLGSDDALKPGDGILFIEEVNEYKYSFDRLLYQLRNSGTLESIQGLIVGELKGFRDEKVPFGRSLDEIILDNFGDLDIPIVADFPCGHGIEQCTLPVSAETTLSAEQDSVSLRLKEIPVI